MLTSSVNPSSTHHPLSPAALGPLCWILQMRDLALGMVGGEDREEGGGEKEGLYMHPPRDKLPDLTCDRECQ
jgi:hypothetical protein